MGERTKIVLFFPKIIRCITSNSKTTHLISHIDRLEFIIYNKGTKTKEKEIFKKNEKFSV